MFSGRIVTLFLLNTYYEVSVLLSKTRFSPASILTDNNLFSGDYVNQLQWSKGKEYKIYMFSFSLCQDAVITGIKGGRICHLSEL